VYNGTFTKSGGTITGYANDTANGNVVKNSNGVVHSNCGHAVHAFVKLRENTAGPGINLDSSIAGAAGGWDGDFATLTANTWADSNIPTSGSWQLFKFTATADTQSIHVDYGTLTSLNVQVYDSNGVAVGSQPIDTKSIFLMVVNGQEYYVQVSSYYSSSGTYRITFNAAAMPPGTTATTLTANTWADGTITSSSSEQWFKFTATAATQFLHVSFGTLTSLYVQVYESNGATVGSRTELYSSTRYISQTVTTGREYYVKVTPYNSYYSGTYRIAFNATGMSLDATVLTANTWADGAITSGEQWFRFTATTTTQFLHVDFSTLNSSYGLYVQMYDSSGVTVGTQTRLYSNTRYISQTVITGQEYFIKVTPYYSYMSGTYRIAFNTAFLSPNYAITTLTANTWTDGTIISSSGEQWFKFTATASTQFLHVDFGTLDSSNGLNVQV